MQKGESLHARHIDAYWLQRRLSKTYDDPVVAQTKASEVLHILKTSAEDRDIENHLVRLLGCDQFDFIKQLRDNRNLILYCTLLAQEQNDAQRQKLREKMESVAELAPILTQLDSSDSTTGKEVSHC